MKALEEGHEVTHLVTIMPKNNESYMFHYPCIDLTKLQSEALGIKHVTRQSSGKKEEELVDLREVLSGLEEIDGVVSGAVSSEYQKKRIDAICDELGLKNFSPIWGMSALDVLREEVGAGLDILITAVATGELDRTWLGRRLNVVAIEELKILSQKRPFNVQFEGGEGETFVTDCPIFKKKVEIVDFDKIWDNKTSSGYIAVRKSSLIPKQI